MSPTCHHEIEENARVQSWCKLVGQSTGDIFAVCHLHIYCISCTDKDQEEDDSSSSEASGNISGKEEAKKRKKINIRDSGAKVRHMMFLVVCQY